MRRHLKLPHAVREEGVGEEAVHIQEEGVEDMVTTREVMGTEGMVGGGEGEGEGGTAGEVDTNLSPISEFMPCVFVSCNNIIFSSLATTMETIR